MKHIINKPDFISLTEELERELYGEDHPIYILSHQNYLPLLGRNIQTSEDDKAIKELKAKLKNKPDGNG